MQLLVECAVGYDEGMCSLSYWWNVQSAMLVVMVVMEGHGRPWKVMEGHRMSLKVFSYHQIDILSEKSYWWCVQSAMLVCQITLPYMKLEASKNDPKSRASTP